MPGPFSEPPEWYAMVAANLARQEIAPYAHLFRGAKALTILDCGCNRGCWARGAFETFPDAAVEVHAFEPSPRNHAFLTGTHGLVFTPAQLEAIRFNKAAVGEAIGLQTLYSDWDGSWCGSLVKRPDLETAKSETVPTITLDAYAAANEIAAIDILKLDVEGWELCALKGAERLLAAGAVRLILFEFGQIDVYTRTFFRDFWEMLTPLGFDFYFLDLEAKLVPVLEYDGRWEIFSGTVNYVARHKSLPGPLPALAAAA